MNKQSEGFFEKKKEKKSFGFNTTVAFSMQIAWNVVKLAQMGVRVGRDFLLLLLTSSQSSTEKEN